MADAVAIQLTPIFIFLYPQQPLVEDSLSVVATTTPASKHITGLSPNIYAETYVTVETTTPELYLFLEEPTITIRYPRRPAETSRRLNRSAWQARLGKRMDMIKRRVLDNNLTLAGHPTDMIRIRVNKDSRTHDPIGKTIIASNILPIILPPLKDVPMRRITNEESPQAALLSLVPTVDGQPRPIEAYCPMVGQLETGDLLFRIIRDSYVDRPYMTVLEVKEELGTIAYASILYVKYNLYFYDEFIPGHIMDEITDVAAKREELQW